MASLLLSSISNLLSKIMLVIPGFSAESVIAREVDKLSKIVCRIRAMLADAEEREIIGEFVKLWLHELKDVAYDVEDILSDFNYNLVSMEAEHKRQIDNRKRKFKIDDSIITPSDGALFLSTIQKVTERFNEICQARDTLCLKEEDGLRRFKSSTRPSSSSFVNPLEIFGRESDKKAVISALMSSSTPKTSNSVKAENLPNFEVVALVAMGGMGKTTLATLVFNDEIVRNHFHVRSWVWVPEFSDEITITRSIVESITNQVCGLSQLDALQRRLSEMLNEKKFLLVLDDIWIENRKFWEVVKLPLLRGAKGSRILITTENHNVVKCMVADTFIPLNGLSKSDSWSLFYHYAFNRKKLNGIPSKIIEIGEKILHNCNGVPLMVRTLGGLLASATDEHMWETVLDNNAWELEECRKSMHILNLSYHGLPPHLKPCFRSCAMFPKGHEFETDRLVRIWAAQGLIQGEEIKHMEVGRLYVDELLQRSFFQNKVNQGIKSKFTMHALMHDLSKWIVGEESATAESKELGKQDFKNTRHLTVIVKKEVPISFGPFQGGLALRSLFIHSYDQTGFHFDRQFFNHGFLLYLHVLDLNFWKSSELPETIGNLKHLRFLGLSGQSLPESVCYRLLNLRTLDLRTRGNYITFPMNISCLQNLRHLIVSPWDV